MQRSFAARIRPLFAVLWATGWIGVAALLLLPMPVDAPGRSDLLAHFLLFAGMAFGAIGFSRRVGQLAWLTLLTIACSIGLEFAQQLVAYRTFDLIDAAANVVGAASGYALALIALVLWLRPTDPALAGNDLR